MKKLLLILIGIVVGLAIAFGILHSSVTAPSSTPTPSPSPTATVSQLNITVTSPQAGAHVAHTFTITGTERTFEQGVVMRVYDSHGAKILEDHTTGAGADVGVFGPYSFNVTVPASVTGNIEVWVFDYSARDGAIIELNKVPLVLQ